MRDCLDGGEPMRPEPPRPLMRELPPTDPYPVDALGSMLGEAAQAINDRVQAPLAICAQSVLAAATLAVQAHVDVELPTGQSKPVSDFYLGVAETGERKTAADRLASAPIAAREKELRERSDTAVLDYLNAKEAWDKARKAATRKLVQLDEIKQALDAIGPPPMAPLSPLITCPEPTIEGLIKCLAVGQPSVGLFSNEGGQFIGGHAMLDDAKLRTAAGLSTMWDGEPIKRVRGGDGVVMLPGCRVAMHLMAQPAVAAIALSDPLLANQGLLSRFLITAPDVAAGSRLWREPSAESVADLLRYSNLMLEILRRPLPLANGKINELCPRALPLSPAACRLWIGFADHIERLLGPGGALEPVRALGNKLAEHAARMAAVLAMVRDFATGEIEAAEMQAGIALAEYYASEALRLFGASQISADLLLAQRLLAWLNLRPQSEVSLVEIYQHGPRPIRDKATAMKFLAILEDHGWVTRIAGGAIIGRQQRRDAWRIVRP